MYSSDLICLFMLIIFKIMVRIAITQIQIYSDKKWDFLFSQLLQNSLRTLNRRFRIKNLLYYK